MLLLSASDITPIASAGAALFSAGAAWAAWFVTRRKAKRIKRSLEPHLDLSYNHLATEAAKGKLNLEIQHFSGEPARRLAVLASVIKKYVNVELPAGGVTRTGDIFKIVTGLDIQILVDSLQAVMIYQDRDLTWHAQAIDGRYRVWKPRRLMGPKCVGDKKLWRWERLVDPVRPRIEDDIVCLSHELLGRLEGRKENNQNTPSGGRWRCLTEKHPHTGVTFWRFKHLAKRSPAPLTPEKAFALFYPKVEVKDMEQLQVTKAYGSDLVTLHHRR